MVRPHIHEVLGYVVQARLSMEELQDAVVVEMRSGYRPTYRGHAWGPEHFRVLAAAGVTIDVAFDLMKWMQFPEMGSRLTDALDRASSLRDEIGKEIADAGGSTVRSPVVRPLEQ